MNSTQVLAESNSNNANANGNNYAEWDFAGLPNGTGSGDEPAYSDDEDFDEEPVEVKTPNGQFHPQLINMNNDFTSYANSTMVLNGNNKDEMNYRGEVVDGEKEKKRKVKKDKLLENPTESISPRMFPALR